MHEVAFHARKPSGDAVYASCVPNPRCLMLRSFISALPALLPLLGVVSADDKKASDKPFDEAAFVAKAASGGMLEVELGKTAIATAKGGDVRNFGKQMVEDHTKVNEELKALAASTGLTVPAKMNEEHQKHFDKLSKMTGEEFDRAYVKHMVEDHEGDVAEFTRAGKEAKSPAVRDFATKTLPVLEKHLEMIKKIAAASK